MPLVKKKDPEIEKQKRVKEAEDYIKQREKLASKQNISSKAAAQQLVAGEAAKQEEQQLFQQEQMKQGELLLQQQKGAELAQQVGVLDPNVVNQNTIEKTPGFFSKEVVGAGLGAAIPGVAGGAAVGAVGGAAVGGVGAVPGAIGGSALGGIGAYIGGAKAKMKSEKVEEITKVGSIKVLGEHESNLRALVTDTNRNPQNAAENLANFNYQMAVIAQNYANLQKAAREGFIITEDATVELARYKMFYDKGGAGEYLQNQMTSALINPNPNVNLITYEEALSSLDNAEQ